MARYMSKGTCNLCGGTFSKAAMTKHLRSGKRTNSASGASPGKPSLREIKTFHIVVEGRYLPDYWMHLEVPAQARLEVLDSFLRRIWLECCGHMSAFTIGDVTYSVAPMAELDDKSMAAKLDAVLHPGLKFYYEYDFGSTTHLALRVVSASESRIRAKDIQVLARNEAPSIPCVSCGQSAVQVCTECIWSGQGWLCGKCAANHECGEEMLLPVVNSPRVGVCAYRGD